MTIRVHLDTDIGGDTDDLCALALLLASPGVDLVGVTTCADAEGLRKSFVEHALKLAGRSGIPVATGARGFLGGLDHFPKAQDSRYWPGLQSVPPGPVAEGMELIESNAQSGATIVAIGPFTNLGMLETLRPGSFGQSPVVVMGGYFGMPGSGIPQWPSQYDYNVQADRVAARIVFDRLNPLIASLNITLQTSLRRRDLDTLRAGGPLSQLMAVQAELHWADHKLESLAQQNPALTPDILNFQYDSLACAAAIGMGCVSVGVERRSLVVDGENLVLTLGADGPERRVVTDVDADGFGAAWLARVRAL